jgi:hypothetical protein
MELSKRSKYWLEAVNRRKSSSASHLRSPAQDSDVCDRSRTAAPALVAAFSSSTAWLKELRTSLSTRWLEVGGHPSVGPGDTLATRGAAEAVSKELGERAECPQRSGGSPSTDPPCPAFDTLSQPTRGAGRSAALADQGRPIAPRSAIQIVILFAVQATGETFPYMRQHRMTLTALPRPVFAAARVSGASCAGR